MQIDIKDTEQRKSYFSKLQQIVHFKQLYATKYLDFGTKIIRVLCYSPEIVLFLKQQFSFVLKNKIDHFDKTIIFWKAEDIKNVACQLDTCFDPKINLRMRIEMLQAGRQYPDINIIDQTFSSSLPIITLSPINHFIEAYDIENQICYYAVDSLEPEELIKRGHLFVQQLNVLLKSDTTNLTHGAVFGYDKQGVLLCARGQRGKSTLTVHSMINGCEYVSDDYQLLEKQEQNLYAYPLYSIITLSPEMYAKMYDNFNGKFCSNNARKDKYVFNIDAYRSQLKTRYPIKACLFPEIVPDNTPSIVECSAFEKGRAIVQFIHSTVMQMRDLNNHETIRKLFYMVQDLPFYKFNLCSNIPENTKYLHQFLNHELPKVSNQGHCDRMLLDITFDLANILDTQDFTIYSMNLFATNLYEMLLSEMSTELIKQELTNFIPTNPNIIDEFNVFIEVLSQKGLLQISTQNTSIRKNIDVKIAKACKFNLSLLEFTTSKTIELIQKGK